jgi:hypothetical protein
MGPCARDGCTKPHVLGDRFCFDHLDPDELEAALLEPDDEDLEQRVQRLEGQRAQGAPEENAMPAAKTSGRLDPPWECGCGRFRTDWPASKAKHLLACDGTPPATSGRIAASSPQPVARKRKSPERTPPAAKKARPVSRPHLRSKKRNRRATVPRKRALVPVHAGTPTPLSSLRVTFLGQLRDARERIDTAISAVEALG